jgi:hypothetical protein
MSHAIQRTGDAEPWCRREPVLMPDGTIDDAWTASPDEVWTTDDQFDPLMLRALGAELVHWGGYPDPEPVGQPEDPKGKALDELIEARAKSGDAVAMEARTRRRADRVAQGVATEVDLAEIAEEKEQAAREAERQRRASIAAAIAAGDEPAALALMTDEERAKHEERKRVAAERAKAEAERKATREKAAKESAERKAAKARKPERDTETITAVDVGEVPAEQLDPK